MRNLKRVLSLALALVMVLGMMVIGTSAAGFADAEKITYEEAVAVMAGIGLYKGDDKGNVNPDVVLTRADAATLLARIMLGSKYNNLSDANAREIFSDVAVGSWYAAEVEYCYNTGLIDGRGDGTFDPTGKLTGIAFAKLLLVALGYDADEQGYVGKDWATNIAIDALTAGLYIKDVDITAELTREQAAQMILQVLDSEMVQYINTFDKATGAAMIVGPLPTDVDFATRYFPGLYKYEGGYAMWGRPVDFVWVYRNKTIYGVMKTPLAVYTESVFECDIAEDLGLYEDVAITKATLNNKNTKVNNSEIDLLATKVAIGAQGRLTEIYSDGEGGVEIVMIDTYLAQVADVTECEYDRNGHLEEPGATLTLNVYKAETASAKDGYTDYTLYSDEDWTFEAGEWLLVYVDAKNDVPFIMGAPEALEGAQTAYTTVKTHEVEDEEYDDSHTFYLDEAGNSTADHTWFFDQYGNLIGVIDIPAPAATYGVISSIYWKDSGDGELGYAWAKITFMDASSKWMKIDKIGGKSLVGVEGKNAQYSVNNDDERQVSSTKQYNEYGVSEDSDFTNLCLYKIETKGGKTNLVPVDSFKGQLTTNKKTLRPESDEESGIFANSKTMFLVLNKKGEYTAITGIKNLPGYLNNEIEMWAAEVGEDDTNAEYVFVYNPKTKGAKSETDFVVYQADKITIKTHLDGEDIEYYTVTGGNMDLIVLPETEDETSYEQNTLIKKIRRDVKNLDGVMILTITDGVVEDYQNVKTKAFELVEDEEWVVKAGALVADFDDDVDNTTCYYEADDETLFIDGTWYDVDDAELVGASSWKTAVKAGKTVIVTYDENDVVSTVYFVDAE